MFLKMDGKLQKVDEFKELSSLVTLRPEHRIAWTSSQSTSRAAKFSFLSKFFTSYARLNLRRFPWRCRNVSAFHLVLAEILLVQTKAKDVARVWPQLANKFDTPLKLARARKSTLTRLLRPLGLQNQRASSLKNIAKTLVRRFGGQVPSSIRDLLSIPHVGLYTAAAVACFDYRIRVPIVDANVLRVLGRITGRNLGKDLRRSKAAWSIAWAILPHRDCRLHNYGLLDFAAQVCTVRQPNCTFCPLQRKCAFGRKIQ